MVEIALTIFAGVVIAAVSSWITVRLSLRKFRTEKWWERKVEAYQKVIEALHNSKACTDKHLGAYMEGREIPEDDEKELRQRSKRASEEIEKSIDIGAFLLSKEALSRLSQYRKEAKEASNTPDWFLFLDADCAATGNCLKDLICIAKRDLQAK